VFVADTIPSGIPLAQMERKSAEFDNMRSRLGKRVQKMRIEKGLTQEGLAVIAGLDRVSVGYVEQGKRAAKLSTLFVIAKSLDAKIADLFEGV